MFNDSHFLAHYTSIDAATSILLNRKFWLTEVRYLNDKAEFFEGANKILDTLKKSNINVNDERINRVIDIFSKIAAGDFFDKLIFTCSFSKSMDTLSQWRSYGLYSIEFTDENLKSIDCSNHECIYDDYGPDSYLDRIADLIWTDVNDLDINDINHSSKVIDALIRGALIFKNHGFEEENEHRAFKITTIDDKNIKYRIKDNIFIPYIELNIPENIELQVRIGPGQTHECL